VNNLIGFKSGRKLIKNLKVFNKILVWGDNVGPDWSRSVYLRVYDRDQVVVLLIAYNCFLSSPLRNIVCLIDHRRHHLMVSGSSVFIFPISLHFFCIYISFVVSGSWLDCIVRCAIHFRPRSYVS
jgi:hypothetical protein